MTAFTYLFRKLWRDRFFTFLKVLGLSIGIATCIIVFKIVYYEFSFDKKIPNRESLYQIITQSEKEGDISYFAGLQPVFVDYIQENSDAIDLVVPLQKNNQSFLSLTKVNGEEYRQEDPVVYLTNNSYFELLPYQWLAGDKNTALIQPHQLVLTASKAEDYFGTQDYNQLLGKRINFEKTTYEVAGIVADLDFPTSFDGRIFAPIQSVEKTHDWQWLSFYSDYQVYVKLKDSQKESFLNQINAKLSSVVKSLNYDRDIGKYTLLALSDKHFATEVSSYMYTANKKMLFGLMGIGIFILSLASINYINLSTAQVPYYAKSIGVRKTLGEKSSRIVSDFLVETLVIVLFAFAIAYPLVKIFESSFSSFMPRGIENISLLLPNLVFSLILIAILSVLSGLYPAFMTSRINVAKILKTQSLSEVKVGSLNLRKSLIVFQFIIAQVFVIGAFIIASQINYMINADLGFDKEAVVTIELPYKSYHNADRDPFLFKQALQSYPEFQKVSLGNSPQSDYYYGNTLIRQTDTEPIELNMNFKYIDEDYFDLFDLKLLAGRNAQAKDSVGVVFINKAARIALGYTSDEEAIGQNLSTMSQDTYSIEGIFDDFHQNSLHISKSPVSFLVSTRKRYLEMFNIKLSSNPKTWVSSLSTIEKEWKTYYPDAPFAYQFLDAQIEEQYESDRNQAKIINLATLITIVLGCLGLIGLVSLTVYQRTKEIGIRKVLGSSVSGIVGLLAKDYLKLISVAILISIPIAWWAMNKWLENFEYRIEIKWWMFLITGFATLFIAFLAVGYRSVKAAMANPVESLRDE